MDCIAKHTETTEKLPKKWSYLVGSIVILASEFLLRDVFLSRNFSASHVTLAILMEWVVFVFLLAFLIPRIEGNDLHSIGVDKLKWKYLWVSVLVYFVLFIISIGSE